MEPTFSPDGTIRIDWEEYGGRMSHVIYSPQIKWVATGKPILAMGSNWDGSVKWLGDGNPFLLHLRGYAWGGQSSVMIDPANDVFRIGGEDGKPELLADLQRRLHEEIDPPVTPAGPAEKAKGAISTFFWWVVAILILAGAILMIVDIAHGKMPWKHPRKEPPKTLIREIPKPTLPP